MKKKELIKALQKKTETEMHNIVFTVSSINVKALFCHASLN